MRGVDHLHGPWAAVFYNGFLLDLLCYYPDSITTEAAAVVDVYPPMVTRQNGMKKYAVLVANVSFGRERSGLRTCLTW